MTEQYWLPLKMPSGKAKIHIFSRAFIGQKMGFHTESNPTSRNGVETCVIGVKKPGLAKNFKLFCKKMAQASQVNHFPQFTALEMKSFDLTKQLQVILNYGYAQPGMFSTNLAHK